jgi:hypothetical protein
MSIVNGSEGISGDVNNGSEEPHSIYVLIIVAYVVWSFLPDASWTDVDCGGLCGVIRKHWNGVYHFLRLFYVDSTVDSTPAPYMFSMHGALVQI